MRKVASLVAVLAFSTSAFAATVGFSSSALDRDAGTAGLQVFAGDSVSWDVAINTSLSAIQGIDLVLGTEGTAYSWAYSAAINAGFTTVNPPTPFSIYPFDFGLGGNNLTTPIPASNILFGTATFDTTGLADGTTVDLIVDPARDFGLSAVLLGANSDPFEGATASFTVIPVPEPATFALLGLGAVSLLRRRRAA